MLLGGRVSWGERLHTRNHTSEIPSENATESPLDTSSKNPLGKCQSFGNYNFAAQGKRLRAPAVGYQRGFANVQVSRVHASCCV